MENDNNNGFIFKGLIVGFIALFLAWCLFYVRGFAYNLTLYDYNFNGFDSNADYIFTDFIKNDLDLVKYTERENFNVLKDKLIKGGYSEDYINQFKIVPTPSPTPYVMSDEERTQKIKDEIIDEINTKNQLKSEILEELQTDNGATDSIVSDQNMEIRTTETSTGHNLDDIYDLLTDIYNSQYSINENLTNLDDKVSDIQYYKSVEQESPIEKPIEEYNTKETLLLVIGLFLLLGGIGFFIFKFTPTFRG